jgi:alpha-tubulin suppressor-like RCC1 family protein
VGDNETPAAAGNVSVGASVASVHVGNVHTCVRTTAGTVRCWGWGFYGQLGYGNANDVGDNELPSSAGDVDVGGTVIQLATGRAHTCALLEGGTVRCWGIATTGQIGYGNYEEIGDNESPASAGDVNVGGVVEQLAAGGDHTCALLSGGAVRCWGHGNTGQLGYGNAGTIGDNEVPASAGNVDVGGAVVQIATGANHTCALLEGGAVRCWGANAAGQLGLSTTSIIGDNEQPSSVPTVDIGGTAVYIDAGVDHTCAVLSDGNVVCWGEGSSGRLGYGDPFDVGDNEHPYTKGTVTVGGTVEAIGLGLAHTCAKLQDGNVRCWGEGDAGRLGYGDTIDIGDDETPASKGDVPYN